jgi:hypothetical protein
MRFCPGLCFDVQHIQGNIFLHPPAPFHFILLLNHEGRGSITIPLTSNPGGKAAVDLLVSEQFRNTESFGAKSCVTQARKSMDHVKCQQPVKI